MNKSQTYELMDLIAELASYVPLPLPTDLRPGLNGDDYDMCFRVHYQRTAFAICHDLIKDNGWEYVKTGLLQTINLLQHDRIERRHKDQMYLHLITRRTLKMNEPHDASTG